MVVGTYAVRAIDWVCGQLPVLLAILVSVAGWLSTRSGEALQQPSVQAAGSLLLVLILIAVQSMIDVEAPSRPLARRLRRLIFRWLSEPDRGKWRKEGSPVPQGRELGLGGPAELSYKGWLTVGLVLAIVMDPVLALVSRAM
jgi:hypothetical protein